MSSPEESSPERPHQVVTWAKPKDTHHQASHRDPTGREMVMDQLAAEEIDLTRLLIAVVVVTAEEVIAMAAGIDGVMGEVVVELELDPDQGRLLNAEIEVVTTLMRESIAAEAVIDLATDMPVTPDVEIVMTETGVGTAIADAETVEMVARDAALIVTSERCKQVVIVIAARKAKVLAMVGGPKTLVAILEAEATVVVRDGNEIKLRKGIDKVSRVLNKLKKVIVCIYVCV